MLVELARQLKARILTTDHALARIAQIEGVQAINLHDVAAVLKPTLIPGDRLALRLLKPGEQAEQAVGYLDDGTMVVVEHAAHMVGQDASVIVGSAMQTSAGRLIFARLEHPSAEAPGQELHSLDAPADSATHDIPEHHQQGLNDPASQASASTSPAAAPAPPAVPAPALTPSSASAPASVPSPGPQRIGPLGPKAIASRRGPTPRNPRRTPPPSSSGPE